MTREERWLITWSVLLLMIVALTALLSGCPPLPPPDPHPPSADAAAPRDLAVRYRTCVPAAHAGFDDVCPGLFTPEGLACARCGADVSCLNEREQVYCTAAGCVADDRCRARPARAGGRR